MHQFLRLTLEATRGGRHLFDQSGVFLRDLIHLRYCLAHLGNTQTLFAARSTDFAHDVGYAANAGNNLGHCGPSLINQGSPL